MILLYIGKTVNGMGTVGFSIITPIYGSLVDITGGYGASIILFMAGGVAMTLIFILFLEETYGGSPET